MGSAPVLFTLPGSTPGTLAIMFGKDGNAYLLDRTNLGGVGAALAANTAACTPTNTTNACATLHAATDAIITAPALYTTATATYVAFRGNGAKCTSGSGDLTTLKYLSPIAHPRGLVVRGGRRRLAHGHDVERHRRRHRLDPRLRGRRPPPCVRRRHGRGHPVHRQQHDHPQHRTLQHGDRGQGAIFVPADNAVMSFTLQSPPWCVARPPLLTSRVTTTARRVTTTSRVARAGRLPAHHHDLSGEVFRWNAVIHRFVLAVLCSPPRSWRSRSPRGRPRARRRLRPQRR